VCGGLTLQEMSYEAKPQSYYTKPRADYVELLPEDPNASILELGCGDGATGALALRNGKCGSYVGIEMFVPMAERARQVLTSVHVGNVENMELPYAAASFDALILSEVLEHLVDPQAVLNRLAVLLRPGALVFASSPNIAHWSNIKGLCLGRFEYTESGMMDRTHLRWFTPASFAAMFEAAGVKVDRVAPLNRLGRRAKLLRFLLGRRFDAVWFYQINLHGHRI
jgi:SAM-dependent methyltransferase